MRKIVSNFFRSIKSFFRRYRLEFFLVSILLAIGALVIWPYMVYTIYSGEAGVMFKRFNGTQMDKVYPEGIYVIYPWDKLFIYNVRVQTVAREIEVLTKGGLPITLTVVIRYRPDYNTLTQLHTHVGPDYVEKVVLPETISVLREHVGHYEPVEIYTTQRGFLDRIVLNALEQSERRFVIIDDVMIRSIKLPEPVRKSIEDKLIFEQKKLAYEYRLDLAKLEATRKRYAAAGVRDQNKIINESLTEDIIRWRGIIATEALATSTNAKTVIIGSGKGGLPVILGNVDSPSVPMAPTIHSSNKDEASTSEQSSMKPNKAAGNEEK